MEWGFPSCPSPRVAAAGWAAGTQAAHPHLSGGAQASSLTRAVGTGRGDQGRRCLRDSWESKGCFIQAGPSDPPPLPPRAVDPIAQPLGSCSRRLREAGISVPVSLRTPSPASGNPVLPPSIQGLWPWPWGLTLAGHSGGAALLVAGTTAIACRARDAQLAGALPAGLVTGASYGADRVAPAGCTGRS